MSQDNSFSLSQNIIILQAVLRDWVPSESSTLLKISPAGKLLFIPVTRLYRTKSGTSLQHETQKTWAMIFKFFPLTLVLLTVNFPIPLVWGYIHLWGWCWQTMQGSRCRDDSRRWRDTASCLSWTGHSGSSSRWKAAWRGTLKGRRACHGRVRLCRDCPRAPGLRSATPGCWRAGARPRCRGQGPGIVRVGGDY